MVLAESPILSKYLDLDIPYLNIVSKSIRINGGSATQFLKADGSLDSQTYSPSTHKHYIGTTLVQYKPTSQSFWRNIMLFNNSDKILQKKFF